MSIKDTYTQFLAQLLKTKCLYKGETDIDSLKKQEILLTMIDNIQDVSVSNMNDYLNTINNYIQMIKEKKPNTKISDDNFLNFLCKMFEKKHKHCGNVFFLNNEKEKNQINVGLIMKNQNTSNAYQLKNYLYMLYVECCNSLYEDIKDSSNEVYKNYHEMLDDFSKEPKDDMSDIKNELKSLLTDIMPDSQLGSTFNSFMNDKKFGTLLDGVIKTVCPEDKMDQLRDELRKTDRNEIKKTVDEMKNQLANININEVISSFKNEKVMEQVAKTMKDLNVEGINKEDIDNAFKSLEDNDNNVLDETFKSLFKNV